MMDKTTKFLLGAIARAYGPMPTCPFEACFRLSKLQARGIDHSASLFALITISIGLPRSHSVRSPGPVPLTMPPSGRGR
jgi:hypothetical protein